MIKEFIVTADGSQTIYLPEMDEHYHSVHGAIQESRHVYIDAGFMQVEKDEIKVLEIGFGTGLNAFLTMCQAEITDKKVNYVSLEKFPLGEKEYQALNYPDQIFPGNEEYFRQLHECPWNQPVALTQTFEITKVETDLTAYIFADEPTFELVYFDAFAPDKQPEMWTGEVLSKVVSTMAVGGIFTTYCAKGVVRRALASFGLTMERIPGPTGKKEILRGKKA